jgi:tripartite ATP-independent transporter DctM subunit
MRWSISPPACLKQRIEPMIAAIVIVAAVLIIIGLPIAFALGLASVVGILVQGALPMEIVAQRIVNTIDKNSLLAVPLFVLAGEIMNSGGITNRLMNFARALVGHMRGGLAQVNVVISMFFAGVSGSATADAAAFGKILIPSMRKEGFDDGFSVSITAATATLGPILPPSVVMIVYASMTNLSIGRLFMAGLVPGILIGLLFMALARFFAIRRNYPRHDWVGFGNLLKAFGQAFFSLIAPGIIAVGIVGGVFTATEAGAIVVAYAMIIGAAYGDLNWANFTAALWSAAESTGIILFMVATASVVGWLLAIGGFPAFVVDTIGLFGDNYAVVILVIIIVLLLIGMILDGMAAMIILVPVLFPVAAQLGLDQIQFAMVVILCTMIGAITPPVGLLLYISCQVGGVSPRAIGWSIWPFVGVMLLVTVAVAFIPKLSLWLPDVVF